MKLNQKYKVIGLMSGTSLDGLDIAFCEFEFKQRWRFNIREAQTFSYSSAWKKNLSTAHQIDAAQAMHIGDDVRDDVQGAEAVGMTGILLNRRSNKGEQVWAKQVSALRMILPYL